MKAALLWLETRRQFVAYCAIGASGALLDFLVYSLIVKETQLHYEIANAIGYASGTVLSFFLNAHFNFKTRDALPRRFLLFCGVAFLGWVLSSGILFVTVDRLDWDKYLAKLATIVAVVLLQYNLNRLVSFKK
jgi:putative flippase GtrA